MHWTLPSTYPCSKCMWVAWRERVPQVNWHLNDKQRGVAYIYEYLCASSEHCFAHYRRTQDKRKYPPHSFECYPTDVFLKFRQSEYCAELLGIVIGIKDIRSGRTLLCVEWFPQHKKKSLRIPLWQNFDCDIMRVMPIYVLQQGMRDPAPHSQILGRATDNHN